MDAIPLRARFGTREVARLLGCSRAYVSRQCLAGAWPCSMVAGRYRFTLDDLDAIAAMTRREPRRQSPVHLTFTELPRDAEVIVPSKRRPPVQWRQYAKV